MTIRPADPQATMEAEGMGDLFDWMDEDEIAAIDGAGALLPAVIVVDPHPAPLEPDTRIDRLSDAGLMHAVGISINGDACMPSASEEWQARFLVDFVVAPILSGRRIVVVQLDRVVEWCRDAFGDGPEDRRDWSVSKEFGVVDRYLADLVDAGILRLAVNRIDYAVKESIVAAFDRDPVAAPEVPYWWEQLGLNIGAELRGNMSVAAHEINASLAQADLHWRDFELEECLACVRRAKAAGLEISTDTDGGISFFLDVLTNWIAWELRRRDLGGYRWFPYRDGVGPTPVEVTHARIMSGVLGPTAEDQAGRDEPRRE